MMGFLLSMLVWLVAAAALWLALRTLANRLSGLRGRLDAETGSVLRASRWGHAEVNGVGFQDSIRVMECQDGWLIQAHWALGGGRLWLPHSETRVGELDRPAQWSGSVLILETGPNRVRLKGELAEFVAEPLYGLSDFKENNDSVPPV
jgi:hypothetical protein